jgi:hypothetical protein
VTHLSWSVRHSVNEFLAFARKNGLTKRSRVVKALDEHELRARIIGQFVEPDPAWSKYLNHL